MFNYMVDLPIKYFDTNGRGDIMSYYTNDVDTLRQMISCFPPQIISGVTLNYLRIAMYYAIILGLYRGGAGIVPSRRAHHQPFFKYFLRQQVTLANEAFMKR